MLAKQGFTLVDPGRYQNLTDDFSAQISAFRDGKVEIVTGVVLPPDFTTFWTQANQQGFKPKAASVGKAILFPVAVEALGKTGHNLSSEVWWTPSHPFKSSLNGMSAAELAAGFTAATRRQWTQPIGFIHSLFEVGGRRAQARRGSARSGAWSSRSPRPTCRPSPARSSSARTTCRPSPKNVAKTPLVGGQWRLKDDGKYEIIIVDNQTAPSIPVGGKMEPIA